MDLYARYSAQHALIPEEEEMEDQDVVEDQDEIEDQEEMDDIHGNYETLIRPRDLEDLQIELDMLENQGILFRFLIQIDKDEYSESLDLEMVEESPSPMRVKKVVKKAQPPIKKDIEFESSSEDEPISKQRENEFTKQEDEESSEDEMLDGSQTTPPPPKQSTKDLMLALKKKYENVDKHHLMTVLRSCSGFTDVADRVLSGREIEVRHKVFSLEEDEALMGFDEVC